MRIHWISRDFPPLAAQQFPSLFTEKRCLEAGVLPQGFFAFQVSSFSFPSLCPAILDPSFPETSFCMQMLLDYHRMVVPQEQCTCPDSCIMTLNFSNGLEPSTHCALVCLSQSQWVLNLPGTLSVTSLPSCCLRKGGNYVLRHLTQSWTLREWYVLFHWINICV